MSMRQTLIRQLAGGLRTCGCIGGTCRADTSSLSELPIPAFSTSGTRRNATLICRRINITDVCVHEPSARHRIRSSESLYWSNVTVIPDRIHSESYTKTNAICRLGMTVVTELCMHYFPIIALFHLFVWSSALFYVTMSNWTKYFWLAAKVYYTQTLLHNALACVSL